MLRFSRVEKHIWRVSSLGIFGENLGHCDDGHIRTYPLRFVSSYKFIPIYLIFRMPHLKLNISYRCFTDTVDSFACEEHSVLIVYSLLCKS